MSDKKKGLLFIFSLAIFIGLVWAYYNLISENHLITKYFILFPVFLVVIISKIFYKNNRQKLLNPANITWHLPRAKAHAQLTKLFDSSVIETKDGLANWKILAAVPESGTIKAEISFFDKTVKRTMICQAEVTPDSNGNSSVISLHFQASSSADVEILKSIITQTDLCLVKCSSNSD